MHGFVSMGTVCTVAWCDSFNMCFFLLLCSSTVQLAEMLQVLRGAGRVGSALVNTQGEHLRLMACNSSIGGVVKAAQDVVEGLVGTAMGGSTAVSLT